MGDYADSHELFTVVAAIHHQGVCEALNDGALGFSETLAGIAAGGVGDVDGRADLDVIAGGRNSTLACGSQREVRDHTRRLE